MMVVLPNLVVSCHCLYVCVCVFSFFITGIVFSMVSSDAAVPPPHSYLAHDVRGRTVQWSAKTVLSVCV